MARERHRHAATPRPGVREGGESVRRAASAHGLLCRLGLVLLRFFGVSAFLSTSNLLGPGRSATEIVPPQTASSTDDHVCPRVRSAGWGSRRSALVPRAGPGPGGGRSPRRMPRRHGSSMATSRLSGREVATADGLKRRSTRPPALDALSVKAPARMRVHDDDHGVRTSAPVTPTTTGWKSTTKAAIQAAETGRFDGTNGTRAPLIDDVDVVQAVRATRRCQRRDRDDRHDHAGRCRAGEAGC